MDSESRTTTSGFTVEVSRYQYNFTQRLRRPCHKIHEGKDTLLSESLINHIFFENHWQITPSYCNTPRTPQSRYGDSDILIISRTTECYNALATVRKIEGECVSIEVKQRTYRPWQQVWPTPEPERKFYKLEVAGSEIGRASCRERVLMSV